jgi:hypothetical protein
MRDIETSIGAAEGRGPDRLGDEVRVSLKEPRPKVLLFLTLSCFLVDDLVGLLVEDSRVGQSRLGLLLFTLTPGPLLDFPLLLFVFHRAYGPRSAF